MLASGYDNGNQSATLRKILHLLAGLRQTQTGEVLFGHIQQMLEEYEASWADIEQSYACLTGVLLDAFSTHLENDSALLAQIKALQTRLTPPLSQAELSVLHVYIEKVADQITQDEALGPLNIEHALLPLLREFGFDTVASQDPASRQMGAKNRRNGNVHYLHSKEEGDSPTAWMTDGGDRDLSLQMSHLKATLSEKLNEAIAKSEELSTILESEIVELRELDDIEAFRAKRESFVAEMEGVLAGQRQLMQHFHHISNNLALLETDSERLCAELNHAMLLSLTDELTGLSNRRAFVQRLEDELSRAQRYASPLTVAFIDIDWFKRINDAHGHAVGDAVLQEYAQKVLSAFRHHDVVARYGGEEFAIIFPNTDIQGALRALQKVQQRAAQHSLTLGGVAIPLPSFSGGVAIYEQGESLHGLINRADEALYRAKECGRKRIEVAETATAD